MHCGKFRLRGVQCAIGAIFGIFSVACVGAMASTNVGAFPVVPEMASSLATRVCLPFDYLCWYNALYGSSSSASGMARGEYHNRFGSRSYSLYLPKTAGGGPLGLVVMLHGCFQTAEDFAAETGMNAIADKQGFAVLYPEQGYQDNIWKCWNWFLPENQARDSGELSLVVGMVGEVGKAVRLDPSRIYVVGLSAGGAMASNMLACYSDLFAGGAVASGMEFRAATNEAEAHRVAAHGSRHDMHRMGIEAARCSGPGARMVALLTIFGTADPYVNPVNSHHVVEQFTKMNDILDDGLDNDSQTTDVIASHSGEVPGGYDYTSRFYGGRGKIHIEEISVDGMGHAWSGAVTSGEYADPKGPGVSEMIWLFLTRYGNR